MGPSASGVARRTALPAASHRNVMLSSLRSGHTMSPAASKVQQIRRITGAMVPPGPDAAVPQVQAIFRFEIPPAGPDAVSIELIQTTLRHATP